MVLLICRLLRLHGCCMMRACAASTHTSKAAGLETSHARKHAQVKVLAGTSTRTHTRTQFTKHHSHTHTHNATATRARR